MSALLLSILAIAALIALLFFYDQRRWNCNTISADFGGAVLVFVFVFICVFALFHAIIYAAIPLNWLREFYPLS